MKLVFVSTLYAFALYAALAQASNFVTAPVTIKNVGVPPVDQNIADDMARYTELNSTFFVTWRGNDKMVVNYRYGNTYQLFQLNKPQGSLLQLTDFEEPVYSAVINPEPLTNTLIFQKDSAGDEQHQLFTLNLDNGENRLLTDGESKSRAVSFSHDGKQITFADNSRSGHFFDVYTMDPDIPESKKLVYRATRSAYPSPAWSRDSSKLLIVEYISASEVYSHFIDLKTNKSVDLTPKSNEPIYFTLTEFTAGDKYALGLSNLGTEFRKLIKMDLQSRQISAVSNNIDWDVTGVTLNRAGTEGAFVINENGISKLYRFDTVDFNIQQIPFADGIIYSAEFSPDGNHLALTFSNARNNSNVHVINLADNTSISWTKNNTGLDLQKFVEPELIHFPTFDKDGDETRIISAFYYKPANSDAKHPVVISIHGGPEGQFRPGFQAPARNYWINELGIAIIAPNVRGSSGYGKTYLSLDNGLKREDSVRDIGALIKWIKQQPELDANRIAVYGGSYGGYMVLASMIHFADDLSAGVDVVGISNFVTFLQNTSDYRRDLRRAEYGDERIIGDFLQRISPSNNATKISKPLFVIQGARDPRVPASESSQMVETLKNSKIPVWYQVGSNEGHGFRKKDNRDFMDYSIVKFWQTFLLNN